MSFTWEWALAIFVFLFANLFLWVQLLKLFGPLRMLKLTAKMRKEAVDPQSWLGLAADENAVRAALRFAKQSFCCKRNALRRRGEVPQAVVAQLGLYDCNTGAGLCAAAVGERQ